MKTNKFLISVSIDEFNTLHASGFLRIDGNRLVPTYNHTASAEVIASLVAKMPEFMDSDEHAALVLFFELPYSDSTRKSPASRIPDFRHILSAEDCRKVIPLTPLAKSLLEGRLGGQIVLSPPVFEAEMVALFKDRVRMRSLHGGNSLVTCLLDTAGRSVSSELAERADTPLSDGFDPIARALDFTRTKPMVREPISGLRDLGTILLEGLPGRTPDSLLMELIEWLKPRQETLVGFRKVYSDAGLLDLLGRIADKHYLPLHGASLAIFLHWRELAVNAGGLDLDALEIDIGDLAACVPGSVVIDALWLLGFTAGFETFASAYYERLPGVHPFAATRKNNQTISLSWPSSNPPAPATKEETKPKEEPKPSGESDEKTGTDEQEKSETETTTHAEPAQPSSVPKPADDPKESSAFPDPETDTSPTPEPEAEATKSKKSGGPKKKAATKKKAAAKKSAPTKKRTKAKKNQDDDSVDTELKLL